MEWLSRSLFKGCCINYDEMQGGEIGVFSNVLSVAGDSAGEHNLNSCQPESLAIVVQSSHKLILSLYMIM